MEAKRASTLIAGLPDHLALTCILARLPRALLARSRCVCRAWRDALQPAAITALRKSLAISEAWPIAISQTSCSHRMWLLVDPLLCCCYPFPPLSLPHVPPWSPIAASGSHLIAADTSKRMFVLDAANMQWKSLDISPMQHHSKPSFSMHVAVAVDGFLYTADSGHWQRLDLRSSGSSWERLPEMHQPRDRWMTTVAFDNGCLCAVGGVSSTQNISSGEVWNPSTCRWTTIPDLWPLHVFIDTYYPPIAVLRGKMYAFRSHTREIVTFEDATKTWEPLFTIPNQYIRAQSLLCHKLLAVGDELWLMWIDDIDSKKEHILCVQVPTDTLTSRPLPWKILPLEFSENIEFGKHVVYV